MTAASIRSMEDLSYGSTTSSTSNQVTNAFPNLQSRRTRVLDFHSGRKCPTCSGTGKLPKGANVKSTPAEHILYYTNNSRR